MVFLLKTYFQLYKLPRYNFGHRWIPLTKASDAEFFFFIWSASAQTTEQTIKTPVIWNVALIMTPL